MKNRKAFTLVELLAVIVILGLMMGIAIPNIMGIIKKQKQSTYLEDAKKMISRAEYMLRSTTKVEKPSNNNCVVMTLGYLDNGEFNSPPYGGAYFANLSYVVVKNVSGEYKYWVQLYECQTPGAGSSTPGEGGYTETLTRECDNLSGTGLILISSTDPYLNDPKTVQTATISYSISGVSCTGTTPIYTASKGKVTSITSDIQKEVIFDYND